MQITGNLTVNGTTTTLATTNSEVLEIVQLNLIMVQAVIVMI